jgi:hypothetical protein
LCREIEREKNTTRGEKKEKEEKTNKKNRKVEKKRYKEIISWGERSHTYTHTIFKKTHKIEREKI